MIQWKSYGGGGVVSALKHYKDATWLHVATWLHTVRNNKKSLNKNGNTFCCELLNRTGLGQCVMPASTKLCSAFLEFFTVLENKRLFQLRPVPQGIFIRSLRVRF